MSNQYHCDSNDAFAEAIANGHFVCDDEASTSYAGNWMYMYHQDGKAHFKNIMTRDYVSYPSVLPPLPSTGTLL